MIVGSKGGSGIAQWIISNMPAHRIYVEAFLGRGVIMKTKLRASRNIGIEADPKVISRYWRRRPKSEMTLIEGNALTVLPALKLKLTDGALIYADPPYLGTVRKDINRVYYGRELMTEAEHKKLLSVLTRLQAMVMISGYRSQLYADHLGPEWRMETKWTVTRGGARVEECLWMNFGPPIFLHDARFVGPDFTGRQAVKRKIERWKRKFLAMGYPERSAILESLTAARDLPQSTMSDR
jgi:DNA adenine methylase